MTYANTSSANKQKGLRPMRTPRLWVWVVSCLTTFFGYTVPVMISLAMTRSDISRIESQIRDNPSYGASFEEGWQQVRLTAVARGVLGFEQPAAALVTMLAVLIGLEIFAYLHDMRSLDFYESLPEKRNHRFMRRLLSGAATFAVPAAVNVGLSLLVCAFMGALNAAVLLEAVLAFVFMLILFAGIYGITVLASMLSGRILIAGLMAGFLLLAELVIRFVLYIFAETYFVTWTDPGIRWFGLLTNPLGPWLTGLNSVEIEAFSSAGILAVPEVFAYAGGLAGSVLHMAVIAAAALLLSWLVYRKRPAEFAGGALRYPVLQTAVKWITVVTAALLFSVGIQLFIGGRHPRLMMVLAVLACAAGCIIGEMIFARDGRAAFRKPWHMAVCAAIALLVIFCMRFDWIGYDRYVPAANRVESVSFYPAYNTEDHCYYLDPENPASVVFGYRPEEYFEKQMRLTDPETIEAVRNICPEMAAQMREFARTKYSQDSYSLENYTSPQYVIVAWHLKNGRTVRRRIEIFAPAENASLGQILADPAYKAVMYQKIGDGLLSGAQDVRVYLMQTTQTDEVEDADAAWVRDFYAAYDRDLAAQSLQSLTTEPIRMRVTVSAQIETAADTRPESMTHSYPVYEDFSETLAFLGQHGFDSEAAPDAGQVQELTVYVPLEQPGAAGEEDPVPVPVDARLPYATKEQAIALECEYLTYTDPAKVEALLDIVSVDREYSPWVSQYVLNQNEERRQDVLQVSAHLRPHMTESYGDLYEEESWWSGTIAADAELPAFLEEDIREIDGQIFLK